MRELTIYRQYFTESDCFHRGAAQTPRGVQMHSTGANNPCLKRYVQPDDGRLGVNPNGNSHNRPGGSVCASAYIGKLRDGTVAVYQTLPWTYRCWLSGSGKNGSANKLGYIGVEICEDSTRRADYFDEAVRGKAVLLTAHLCQMIGTSPWEIIRETPGGPACAVMDHAGLHRIGLASNHGDIGLWLRNFGYTFDDFRHWVQAAMEEGVNVRYMNGKEESPMDHPTLRKGDVGEAVARLQTMLSAVGAYVNGDGVFGSKTDAAVRAFQAAEGLTVDGVAGPKTWAALEQAANHGAGDGQPDEPPMDAESEQPAGNTPLDADAVTVSREDWDTLRRIVRKYDSVG